jgi:tRNA threonylcarbamoyladenosine biosynthesis protein TsaB
MIDRLTRGRGWSPTQIDHVYVSAGPGSFTGLRIGITLAKTLALATGCKIVAVPSALVLLANADDHAREVLIVLDAKRGQIFTARFARVDATSSWAEVEAAHLDTLAAMLSRAARPVHLIGEGIPYHLSAIPDSPDVIVTDESLWRARAQAVAAIGSELARDGQFTDPLKLTPIYVRLPEAEEKRLIAEGKLIT